MRKARRERSVVLLALSLIGGFGLHVSEARADNPALLETREIVSLRDVNSRVHENTYESDILDDSGNPTGEKEVFQHRFFEVGTGISYNTAAPGQPPVWEKTDTTIRPSKEEGVDYEVLTGPAKVRFSRDQDGNLAAAYEVEGRPLVSRLEWLGYYDRQSGAVQIVHGRADFSRPRLEGNRVVYNEVFPGVDVEYVYEPASFHQNIIHKSKATLPAMDARQIGRENACLVSGTRLKLKSYGRLPSVNGQPLAESAVREGENIRMAFRLEDERIQHSFAEGEAWDAQGPYREPISVFKRIAEDGDDTWLLEGIPLAWAEKEERQFPVVIDYVQTSTFSQGNLVWKKGYTYWVSQHFLVPANKTLIVEGGAIVKLAYNKGINLTATAHGSLPRVRPTTMSCSSMTRTIASGTILVRQHKIDMQSPSVWVQTQAICLDLNTASFTTGWRRSTCAIRHPWFIPFGTVSSTISAVMPWISGELTEPFSIACSRTVATELSPV